MRKITKRSKYEWFMIIGLFFILIAPWVFTRPSKWESFDFSKSGEIGDTIGGITAPIINSIGAILVFYSFKAQNKANKLQKRALNNEIKRNKQKRNFEILLSFINEAKNDLNSIFMIKESKEIVGRRAINVFITELDENVNSKKFYGHMLFNDLSYICNLLIITHKKINEFSLSENDKELLTTKFKILYNHSLSIQIDRLLNIKKKHNIIEQNYFFEKIEELKSININA